MNRSRLAVKLAIAAGLSLILTVELLPSHPLRPVLKLHDPVAVSPTASAARHAVADWAQLILARPLFRADRRPVPVAGKGPDKSLPRLSAIIIARGDRRAIFAGHGGKSLTLAEGGRIGAYRLDTIMADRISLLGPDGRITLRPQFSDHPGATAAATAHRR